MSKRLELKLTTFLLLSNVTFATLFQTGWLFYFKGSNVGGPFRGNVGERRHTVICLKTASIPPGPDDADSKYTYCELTFHLLATYATEALFTSQFERTDPLKVNAS